MTEMEKACFDNLKSQLAFREDECARLKEYNAELNKMLENSQNRRERLIDREESARREVEELQKQLSRQKQINEALMLTIVTLNHEKEMLKMK